MFFAITLIPSIIFAHDPSKAKYRICQGFCDFEKALNGQKNTLIIRTEEYFVYYYGRLNHLIPGGRVNWKHF